MEQVNEAQPQSQPPSQRFYALEQLGELAGTITLISEGLHLNCTACWSGSALIWSNRSVRPGLS